MYSADPFVTQCRAIDKKPPYDPNNPADQNRRTEEEKNLVGFKRNVFIGFIIAGYWLPDRTPFGFEVPFDPMSASAPTPQRIPIGNYYYAGAPNIIKRLINGTDEGLKDSIMSAGKGQGLTVTSWPC